MTVKGEEKREELVCLPVETGFRPVTCVKTGCDSSRAPVTPDTLRTYKSALDSFSFASFSILAFSGRIWTHKRKEALCSKTGEKKRRKKQQVVSSHFLRNVARPPSLTFPPSDDSPQQLPFVKRRTNLKLTFSLSDIWFSKIRTL